MYLANTGNIMQALDARTGDLIWENHVGPEQAVGIGAMRNLAIYQDKVFIATTDARLVALDARTGKMVWDDARSRTHEGLLRTRAARSSINGKVHPGPARAAIATAKRAASSAPTTRTTGKQLWQFNTVARAASRAATPGASCRRCCAPAAKPGSPAATIPS